jgi:hypothetical protein
MVSGEDFPNQTNPVKLRIPWGMVGISGSSHDSSMPMTV